MPIPMPTIHLTTFIAAPIERVFDLSRNLTIYKSLMQGRKEKFSSGAASNVIAHGETMTFHAKHFGKTRLVTTRVIELQKPILPLYRNRSKEIFYISGMNIISKQWRMERL